MTTPSGPVPSKQSSVVGHLATILGGAAMATASCDGFMTSLGTNGSYLFLWIFGSAGGVALFTAGCIRARRAYIRSELNDEGMALYEEQEYAKAADKFLRALKLVPPDAVLANNAAHALFHQGRYEDSVKYFERSLDLDPGRVMAWFNLGEAYAKLNRKDDAKRAFQNYLEVAPESEIAGHAREKLKALEH